jgi:pyruvate dehydrogenase E2 component (dihydrolipoamide acetyltransferase)
MTTPIEIGSAGGEYMEEVVVIEWACAEGDVVRRGDLLVVVETAKAATEVESPVDGVLRTISVPAGAEVPVNEILGWIDDETGKNTDADSPDVPQSTPTEFDYSPATASASVPRPADDPTPEVKQAPVIGGRIIASPVARRFAVEHGIDLKDILASSPTGRIKLRDVETALDAAEITNPVKSTDSRLERSSISAPPSPSLNIPAIQEIDFSRFGPTERVEMSRIRIKAATNLHRAWLNLPMVTHHDEADITGLEEFRCDLNAQAAPTDTKITALAFHVRALTQALKEFPRFNASLATDGQALIYKKYFHIAIAVDTPDGLLVPVIRDADHKSLPVLAAEIVDLGTRARAKKLEASEMMGACMTISSLGGIGGTAFTPIVNPPEVAILGITRAKMKSEWNGREFVPRLMCPLDLSYDHRVVDGADAARFMAFYCKAIGDIRRLIL